MNKKEKNRTSKPNKSKPQKGKFKTKFKILKGNVNYSKRYKEKSSPSSSFVYGTHYVATGLSVRIYLPVHGVFPQLSPKMKYFRF